MMNDLISKSALIKVVEADINRCYALGIGGVGALSHFIDEINEQPTIEAVPVVHGYWSKTGCSDLDDIYFGRKCSVCGFAICGDACNFCPDCGAKMDGGK